MSTEEAEAKYLFIAYLRACSTLFSIVIDVKILLKIMVFNKEGMYFMFIKKKNDFNDILDIESKDTDLLISTLFLNFGLSYVYFTKLLSSGVLMTADNHLMGQIQMILMYL